MSKRDHDWTITISGRGPCNRGVDKDPDQQMLALAERLQKSGQSIEITDFVAIPLEEEKAVEEPTPPTIDQAQHTQNKKRKRK